MTALFVEGPRFRNGKTDGIIIDHLKAIPDACKLRISPLELKDPTFAMNKPQKQATAVLHKAVHTTTG